MEQAEDLVDKLGHPRIDCESVRGFFFARIQPGKSIQEVNHGQCRTFSDQKDNMVGPRLGWLSSHLPAVAANAWRRLGKTALSEVIDRGLGKGASAFCPLIESNLDLSAPCPVSQIRSLVPCVQPGIRVKFLYPALWEQYFACRG